MRPRCIHDLNGYMERTQTGPCFICKLVEGDLAYPHHILFRDDFAVAFLARRPDAQGRFLTQSPGYTLVAPIAHREHLDADLTLDEHLRLQRLVYRVAGALRETLPTERVYVMSLGSDQGNSHVHWHVVALPPGVPYREQQFHFLMAEYGEIEMDAGEVEELAGRLRSRLAGDG